MQIPLQIFKLQKNILTCSTPGAFGTQRGHNAFVCFILRSNMFLAKDIQASGWLFFNQMSVLPNIAHTSPAHLFTISEALCYFIILWHCVRENSLLCSVQAVFTTSVTTCTRCACYQQTPLWVQNSLLQNTQQLSAACFSAWLLTRVLLL